MRQAANAAAINPSLPQLLASRCSNAPAARSSARKLHSSIAILRGTSIGFVILRVLAMSRIGHVSWAWRYRATVRRPATCRREPGAALGAPTKLLAHLAE